jgi:hypothetical protein
MASLAITNRCQIEGIAPCPLPVCDAPPAWSGAPATLSAATRAAFPPGAFDPGYHPTLPVFEPLCARTTFHSPGLPGADPAPCPSQQFFDANLVPWVTPQPGQPSCTICDISVDPTTHEPTVYLGIAPTPVSPMYEARIVVGSAGVFKLSGPVYDPLLPGHTYKIVLPPLADPSQAKNASLEYRYQGTSYQWTSGQDPLIYVD